MLVGASSRDLSSISAHYPILHQREERENSITNSFPPEILSTIFHHALSPVNFSAVTSVHQARVTIMLVCHYFHQIVVSSPTLWSFLTLAGPVPNFGRLEYTLSYSQGAKLDWHLDLRGEDDGYSISVYPTAPEEEPHWCDEAVMHQIVAGFIAPRMNQTRRLLIIAEEKEVIDRFYLQFLHTPAPVLEEFKLVCGTMPYYPFSGSTTNTAKEVFGGYYPMLQSVSIHIQRPGYSPFTLKNVTNLDLTTFNPIPPTSLMKAISSAPRLSSLTIRHASGLREPYGKESPVAKLAHLNRLVLGGMDGRYILDLLSYIEIPPIRELGLHSIYQRNGLSVWRALLKHAHSTRCFSRLEKLELLDVDNGD